MIETVAGLRKEALFGIPFWLWFAGAAALAWWKRDEIKAKYQDRFVEKKKRANIIMEELNRLSQNEASLYSKEAAQLRRRLDATLAEFVDTSGGMDEVRRDLRESVFSRENPTEKARDVLGRISEKMEELTQPEVIEEQLDNATAIIEANPEVQLGAGNLARMIQERREQAVREGTVDSEEAKDRFDLALLLEMDDVPEDDARILLTELPWPGDELADEEHLEAPEDTGATLPPATPDPEGTGVTLAPAMPETRGGAPESDPGLTSAPELIPPEASAPVPDPSASGSELASWPGVEPASASEEYEASDPAIPVPVVSDPAESAAAEGSGVAGQEGQTGNYIARSDMLRRKIQEILEVDEYWPMFEMTATSFPLPPEEGGGEDPLRGREPGEDLREELERELKDWMREKASDAGAMMFATMVSNAIMEELEAGMPAPNPQ
jgi:hypothetical protein